MMNNPVKPIPVKVDLITGKISGKKVICQIRTIADLKHVFSDEEARMALPQEQLAYEVQLFLPVEEGTPGGLYFGNTTIYPGKVGNEYMMTKGHFHANSDRNEYYMVIRGNGYIMYMDKNRESWVEAMCAGSLHYIGPNLAHRVINTGNEPLTFLASWPADSGHDYATIQDSGFSMRIIENDGTPEFIKT